MGLYVRFLDKTGLSSLDICEVRSVFTAVIMFFVLLFYKPSLLKIKFRDCWIFIGTGIISILFFNFCYFTTIQETQLSFAVIMLYTAPVFVMLLSAVLFKEKITVRKIIALAVAFTGAAFVSLSGNGGGNSITVRGILLGLGSGLGYALYSIFSRYALMRENKTLTIVFWTFVFSALGGIVLVDVNGIFSVFAGTSAVGATAGGIANSAAVGATAGGIANSVSVGATIEGIANSTAVGVTTGVLTSPPGGGGDLFLFCILYAVASTVLPYILYTAGLTNVENGKASVMAFSEPLTATLIGIFVYSEIPGAFTVGGIILMLVALVLLNINFSKKQKA